MNTSIDDLVKVSAAANEKASVSAKESFPVAPGPIGIFDSGYGGLTILHGIRQLLPQYDYIYLGDNARAPYGPRSFDVVYEFTRQAVQKLFEMGCQLVILGRSSSTICHSGIPSAACSASFGLRQRSSVSSHATAMWDCSLQKVR